MGRFISDAAKRALDLLCVVLGGPFVLGIAAYTRHRIKKIAQAMPFTLASGFVFSICLQKQYQDRRGAQGLFLRLRLGEVYNIGGHNEMRNIDIVKLICKELGKPESLITYVTGRKGHDMRYAIDPTKSHNELGWLPETKFTDGIKKTIKWYLENKKWWQDIISGEYQKYYEKMYGNR